MPFEPSRRALLVGAALLPLAPARPAQAATPAGTHYRRAAKLAGTDPVSQALVKALTPGYQVPPVKAPQPLMIFDNVAVVSVGMVSATAVLTSRGVVLIDALGSSAEAEDVLVPQLRSLGVDPAQVKYVVCAHGHADHFGGARHFAERYGARVMMTGADWDLAAGDPHAPDRDLEIADGWRLTLGDTTVSLHRTRGHTPGTVSPIFPVRWKGRRHTAMLWGGTNPPAAVSEKRRYLDSVLSFAGRMRRAGVDVELNNHGLADHGLARLEELRGGSATNPFVIGRGRSQRFMEVMELMIRGRIATDLEAKPAAGGSSGGCC
jgi:metallo-beta-lactamase class B